MDTYTHQLDAWGSNPDGRPWAVLRRYSDGGAVAVEYMRTESGARHCANLLTAGLARIDWHRPWGDRVMPVPSSPIGAKRSPMSIGAALREARARA